jgi:hypothetical protein
MSEAPKEVMGDIGVFSNCHRRDNVIGSQNSQVTGRF